MHMHCLKACCHKHIYIETIPLLQGTRATLGHVIASPICAKMISLLQGTTLGPIHVEIIPLSHDAHTLCQGLLLEAFPCAQMIFLKAHFRKLYW